MVRSITVDAKSVRNVRMEYHRLRKILCGGRGEYANPEQYVCQQLKTLKEIGVYYYTNDRGSCEVDFVVDTGEEIIPLEVKAEVNLRAKSLKAYQKRFSPTVSVRASMADYKREDRLLDLPLYAIGQLAAETERRGEYSTCLFPPSAL